MAVKFNRGYRIFIDLSNGETILIDSTVAPFSLDFDIQRNTFASTNLASIKLYNLGPKTRGLIWKGMSDLSFSRRVRLYLGYGTQSINFPLVFQGSIKQAWSFRQGCDFITQIESFDGGDASVNSYFTATVGTSDSYSGVASNIVSSMSDYGLTLGVIGPSVSAMGNFPLQKTLNGKSYDLLKEIYTGFHVDLEQVNILSDAESLPGTPRVISAQTGLLQSPLQESPTNVSCQILLDPSFRVSQLASLQSLTTKQLNKVYKTIGVQHRGNVSPTVSGDAVTTLTLLDQVAATNRSSA